MIRLGALPRTECQSLSSTRWSFLHKRPDLTFGWMTFTFMLMGSFQSCLPCAILALLALVGDGTLLEGKGASSRNQLVQKLQTIIIPKIEFTEVPLPEALNFLRSEARKHDPRKMGVNLILLTREKTPPKITLNVRNLSLDSSLRFVTELAGYAYEVREQGVVVSKPDPRSKRQSVNPRLQTEIYELSEGLKRRLGGNP